MILQIRRSYLVLSLAKKTEKDLSDGYHSPLR